MLSLVAPNIINDTSFEYLINQLPEPEKIQEKDLLIDLGITEAVYPYGLLGTLELGIHLKNMGLNPRLNLPKNESVLQNMKSSGFIEMASLAFKELMGACTKPAEDPSVLLKVTPVESFKDVHNIVSSVRNRIKENNYSEDDYTWDNIIVAISEICQNIPEHSKDKGFALINILFNKAHKKHLVNIVVMDLGVGIRSSLDNKFSPIFRDRWGDRLAIHKTLFEGVSRYDDPGRGNGIIRTRELVVEKFKGNMSLRSGTAKLWGKIPGWEIERLFRKPLVFLPGAQVNITIPLSQ